MELFELRIARAVIVDVALEFETDVGEPLTQPVVEVSSDPDPFLLGPKRPEPPEPARIVEGEGHDVGHPRQDDPVAFGVLPGRRMFERQQAHGATTRNQRGVQTRTGVAIDSGSVTQSEVADETRSPALECPT